MSTLAVSHRRRWAGGPAIAAVSGSALVALGVAVGRGRVGLLRPAAERCGQSSTSSAAYSASSCSSPSGTARYGSRWCCPRCSPFPLRPRPPPRPPLSGSPSAGGCRSRSGWHWPAWPATSSARSGGPPRTGRSSCGWSSSPPRTRRWSAGARRTRPGARWSTRWRTGPGGPRRTRRTASPRHGGPSGPRSPGRCTTCSRTGCPCWPRTPGRWSSGRTRRRTSWPAPPG